MGKERQRQPPRPIVFWRMAPHAVPSQAMGHPRHRRFSVRLMAFVTAFRKIVKMSERRPPLGLLINPRLLKLTGKQ